MRPPEHDPELPLLNVLKRLLAQPVSLCGDADAHLCFGLHAIQAVLNSLEAERATVTAEAL